MDTVSTVRKARVSKTLLGDDAIARIQETKLTMTIDDHKL
jgi:hypothetical protein